MPVRGELVGHMPGEPGNFVVADLHTDQQWIANLYLSEGELMVLDGRDHSVKSAANYDMPNFRWIKLTPLTRKEIEAYLKVPA